MSGMKKVLLAAGLVGVMASSAMATDVICGGEVQLINNVIGMGMTSLDFGSAGNAVEIADFFINNNSSQWTLTIECNTSGNHGAFLNHALVNAFPPLNPMTAMDVNVGNLGGVLNGGAAVLPAFATASLLANGVFTWGPVTQTAATIMYNLNVTASWPKSTALAGLYFETITATITAIL